MSDTLDTIYLSQAVGQDNFRGKFSTSSVNQFLDVYAYFRNQSGTLVDVTGGKAVITRVKDGFKVAEGNLVRVDLGYYKYSFYAGEFQAGLYNVTFSGDSAGVTLFIQGQIGLQEITLLQSLLDMVRYNLYEVDGTWLGYQLDAPQPYWTDEMIYRALTQALNLMNEHPPTYTQWTLNDCPAPGLLTSGATAICLMERARFEDANTMSYTDAGKSLNMSRGQYYRQMAEEWMRQFKGTGGPNGGGVVGFKFMFRPKIRGMGAQKLPFKVLRPLSFMPNMKNIFGI